MRGHIEEIAADSRWPSSPPSATACAARPGIAATVFGALGAARHQRHRDLAGIVRAEHLARRRRIGRGDGGPRAAPGVSSRARERVGPVSRRSDVMPVRDVLIVGAGPSGLATAIAAKQQGLDYVDRRERCAGQLDLQLSDAHGVLHHAGAARDRRPAARHAVRQAHAARGAALLPARRRHLRPPDLVSRDRRRDRARATMACSR